MLRREGFRIPKKLGTQFVFLLERRGKGAGSVEPCNMFLPSLKAKVFDPSFYDNIEEGNNQNPSGN